MHEFKIENCRLAMFFPKQISVRKKVFELEELLTDRFAKPFTLTQIGDEAPEDIPRIKAKTINGHTELTVSQTNLTMITNFDNGWEDNWDNCKNYIQENMREAYLSLKTLSVNTVYYLGLSINIFIPFESAEASVDFLNQTFIAPKNKPPINELNIRFVFVNDNKIYTNYSFQNTAKFSHSGLVVRMVPAYLIPQSYGVTLGIDINDRYGFNYEREYESEPGTGEEILSMVDEIISIKIHKILDTGEF